MAYCGLNPLQYVKEVAKCIVTEAVWPPLKLHIDYWWCFDGNVQGLRDEIHSFERERRDKEREIRGARLRAESATTEYEDWSKEGTQKIEEATRILQGCDDLKIWCIIPRYSVGKSAKETAQGIAKLRTEGNLITIADPAPIAAEVSISHAPTLEFQSRKSIEEDIMKALKDGNVRMIAICGAGGVGKTTVAQRVADRVREEKLFDEIVTVVVSQTIDMLQIQKQIAEILRCDLSEDTLAGRAHKLCTRLKDSKKKLIIFDDVWERFDPKDIGVPYGGCTIILTSRLEDVCQEMEADKVIELKVLDKTEAWTLFKEKSGDRVDDVDLHPVAEEVAAECKGLPIALVTVGRALKNKNIKTWKDALSQLRRANPMNFPPVLKDVYMPLKMSYDFLETDDDKYLFLLCCLFPEDDNTRIEDLALFSFGLGMFKGINSIEDGRNRTYNLVERLKSRFLLMTGRNEDEEVKMHDVVRDVAIFIGSQQKHGLSESLEVRSMDLLSKDSSRNCNWMAVDIKNIANAMLPIRLDFPNLFLLMILNSTDFEFPEGSDVDVICFKGMEELRVLYFSNQNLQSVPSSLKFLKKLRKLHLDKCEVKDISVVGELASLEILRVLHCNDIEEVPADVGKLKFLRLLELKDCEELKRIVAGVISSLVGLEELKIVNCFDKWEAKGNLSEERNASISELESLRYLTSLEIDISDANLVAEEICLLQQLVRYRIRFMDQNEYYRYFNMKHDRKVKLLLRRDVTVENWIQQLVKSTQSLVLVGDGSTVKKLVNVVDCEFRVLEHLLLRKLRELEEIIDCRIPEGSNSFQYLQSLKVDDCPNLQYLFPVAVLRSLVQLQNLQIYSCATIEQVFWNEMESDTYASIIEFPKLKFLRLEDLPNLAAFSQGVEIIKSPQLTRLYITSCPKLRTKISSRCMIEILRITRCDAIEEIFWNDGENGHIIFPELYFLELSGLPCLTTFCRGGESIKFPKLERLLIGNLARMNSLLLPMDSEPTHDHQSLHFFCNQKVFWNEMESDTYASIIEFPKLKILRLEDLPNLAAFSQGVEIIKSPQLTTLYITSCPKLRTKISSRCMIKDLIISRCDAIEEIFWNDGGNGHIIFPELTLLELGDLPCLTTFCRGVESIKFPKLEDLNLARMNNSVLLPMDSEPTQDHHSLHFFCNQKVEIVCLKILHLVGLPDKISKIWCRHIPISFFHSLEFLDINNVGGVRDLLSSSVANALVNLNWLEISDCKGMLDVISNEDETHVPVNSVFPNLKYLSLINNGMLRSFCKWKHAFELLSLEAVQIDKCPLMETFSLGLLRTSKLRHFSINGKDMKVANLNRGIHNFITKIARKHENKDEDDEDGKHEYSTEDEKEMEGEE